MQPVAIWFLATVARSARVSSRDSNSEDDHYDSDLESIYAVFHVGKLRGELIVKEKLIDYVDRVIPGYDRQEFRQHFRVFPETFEMILTIIGPGLITQGKRYTIPAKKQLLIALWFMATPDSYRSICVKFGVGKATAFRALRRVTYSLHCVAPRFIQWQKQETAITVMQEFERSAGFPSVIGAIDSTHININAPKEDRASYINRKSHHSKILQAVCDARTSFTHCYAGHVGSVHDARVYRTSPISNFVQRPEEYFPYNSHIIGDAAYPIHRHLIVPFRDNGRLTERQKNFNHRLSSTRMVIERAFGLLKIRFRVLLHCLPLKDIMKIPEFIIACCVLHNICVEARDVLPVGVLPDIPFRVNRPWLGRNVELGKVKRNQIMHLLPLRNQARC